MGTIREQSSLQLVIEKLKLIPHGAQAKMFSEVQSTIDDADDVMAYNEPRLTERIDFFHALLDEVHSEKFFPVQDIVPKLIHSKTEWLYTKLRAGIVGEKSK